jgi:hypothetical protein
MGIGTHMWRQAQQATGGTIHHSPDRTDAGDAFARSVGGTIPPRSDWRPLPELEPVAGGPVAPQQRPEPQSPALPAAARPVIEGRPVPAAPAAPAIGSSARPETAPRRPALQPPKTPALPTQRRQQEVKAPARRALPAAAETLPGTAVATTRPSTQYTDADLTIHDVIDADHDMSTQIGDGVAEALSAAHGCERLYTRLESLRAEVIELQVPGALEGMLAALMERSQQVRSAALAIAVQLPAASEAISVAGSNAAARHKPLADAVRDAGHIRPAERQYHDA